MLFRSDPESQAEWDVGLDMSWVAAAWQQILVSVRLLLVQVSYDGVVLNTDTGVQEGDRYGLGTITLVTASWLAVTHGELDGGVQRV